jgi:hypothetical protein
VTISAGQAVGRLEAKTFDADLEVAEEPEEAESTFSIRAATTAFRDTVEDIAMLCHYAVPDVIA